MHTLLLDQATWDLTKDANGNIAMATNPYAIAQDVASACRVFKGEMWYDVTQGVPYLQNILGQSPPPEFIKAQLAAVAGTVPEVVQANVFLTRFELRQLSGQILITDTRGNQFVTGSVSMDELPWYVNAAFSYERV